MAHGEKGNDFWMSGRGVGGGGQGVESLIGPDEVMLGLT